MAGIPAISYANYGFETSGGFGTVSTSMTLSFGHGVKISTLTRKNNVEKIYGLGAPNAQKNVPRQFDGALSVEFILSNPWFFKSFLGAETSTGSSPTTHTFTEQNTVLSFSVHNEIKTDTVSAANLLGCKTNTLTITAAVNELAKVRLDALYANEAHSSTTAAHTTETFDVFSFQHGSLEFPDTSTIAEVQSVEITMTQNPEYIWGLGSRLAKAAQIKQRDYSAKLNVAFEDSSKFLEEIYGASTGPTATASPAETATMELTFTNGLTGANTRSIVLLFTGVDIDEESLPQDVTATIMEDVSVHMRDLTSVIAQNSTTEVP